MSYMHKVYCKLKMMKMMMIKIMGLMMKKKSSKMIIDVFVAVSA